MRSAIQAGVLKPGSQLPSTRDLARQIEVSRPVVVDAYAQLAAEGYLTVRQGAAPRVSESVGKIHRFTPVRPSPTRPVRYDFRPAIPDLASFPRRAWLRSTRSALAGMGRSDLGYSEPHGHRALRIALARYLGRARGVVADADQIIITSGFAQARVLLCRALARHGVSRLAVEDPGYSEWQAVLSTSLSRIPVAVDEAGLQVDLLEGCGAGAVMVTPAHQFPTGVVMSGERRVALLDWLRRTGGWAFEDDYDAEYRYDRSPVSALQPMNPEQVIYAGTASKTLAPALRLGWVVVPQSLLATVHAEQREADLGCPRIEQRALANFIEAGMLDRHLRKMRERYRARRKALLSSIASELPEAVIHGVDAGLHATVSLPRGYDEEAIEAEANRRGIALGTIGPHCIASTRPATLLLGYANSPEAAIQAGVKELARAVRVTSEKPTSPDRSRVRWPGPVSGDTPGPG